MNPTDNTVLLVFIALVAAVSALLILSTGSCERAVTESCEATRRIALAAHSDKVLACRY